MSEILRIKISLLPGFVNDEPTINLMAFFDDKINGMSVFKGYVPSFPEVVKKCLKTCMNTESFTFNNDGVEVKLQWNDLSIEQRFRVLSDELINELSPAFYLYVSHRLRESIASTAIADWVEPILPLSLDVAELKILRAKEEAVIKRLLAKLTIWVEVDGFTDCQKLPHFDVLEKFLSVNNPTADGVV